MSEPRAHRLLVERLARAAAAESAHERALQWAQASDEQRGEALASACVLACEGARASGYRKPPLPLVRLPRRRAGG